MNTLASKLTFLFHHRWVFSAILVLNFSAVAISRADDWMTWASTYTHDATGQRVDQYALPEQPIAQQRADFTRSGFRSYRSTLQVGQSADNFHIVEQWGRAVQPYEQWRFPYHPYAVPYDQWGPQAPYGILNGNFGGQPGFGYPPVGPGNPANPNGQGNFGQGNFGQGNFGQGNFGPGNFGPGNFGPGNFGPGNFGQGNFGPGNFGSRGFPLQPTYRNQPWFDGTYPDAPPLDPRSDAEFHRDPTKP